MDITGKLKISVIGGSYADKDSYDAAFEVGKEIAKRGAILICGGMRGIMEAACRGAKSEEGLTVGILPTQDEQGSNEFLDIRIPTGLGYARNSIVVLAGNAVIAIDGRSGTLSEIGFALTYNKPLIGLNTWELIPAYSDEIPKIKYAENPQEAVRLAISLAEK